MKKLIKITGALLLIISFSQNTNAQEIGGGLSFFKYNGGSDLGINVRGGFALNENMEIVPGVNYYLNDNITLIGLNGDFHYLFGAEGSLRFYPLGGINFMMASANGASNNELQFNVGAGTKYPLSDKLSIYGEGKYVIGDSDGLVFTAGILFNIGG